MLEVGGSGGNRVPVPEGLLHPPKYVTTSTETKQTSQLQLKQALQRLFELIRFVKPQRYGIFHSFRETMRFGKFDPCTGECYVMYITLSCQEMYFLSNFNFYIARTPF